MAREFGKQIVVCVWRNIKKWSLQTKHVGHSTLSLAGKDIDPKGYIGWWAGEGAHTKDTFKLLKGISLLSPLLILQASLDRDAMAWAQTYDEWVHSYNLPADFAKATDTPAGDAIPNIFKYALGLDPNLPGPKTIIQPVIVDREGQLYASVELVQAKGNRTVRLGLAASQDLLTWQERPMAMERIADLGASQERMRILDTGSLDSSAPRFLRLTATLQERRIQLVTQPPIQVLATNLPLEGGLITVLDSTNPLKGMIVTVPSGAYSNSITFRLSYATISAHNGSRLFNPITPLIHIDNGGREAEIPMVLELPVQVSPGAFAAAFRYDAASGALEVLPPLELSSNSIKVVTRHCCDIVIGQAEIEDLPASVDSGFQPGVDDWEFANCGSYLEQRGHCSGQTSAAMYHYLYKREGAGLFKKYDNYNYSNCYNFRTPFATRITDNVLGYRLASRLQRDTDFDTLYAGFWKGASLSARETYNFFQLAIATTGEPQYVAIVNTNVIKPEKPYAHALIVYRVGDDQLSVADPNHPGDKSRAINFNRAVNKFNVYYSGDNALESGKPFSTIIYEGRMSPLKEEQIAQRWNQFENKTIALGDFPEYHVNIKEEDADGHLNNLVMLQSDQPTETVFNTYSGHIQITLEMGSPGCWLAPTSYKYDAYDGKGAFGGNGPDFSLKEGLNTIGLEFLASIVPTLYEWTGFNWIFINRIPTNQVSCVTNEPPVIRPVVTSMSWIGPHTLWASNQHNVTVKGGVPPYTYSWWVDGFLFRETTTAETEDTLLVAYHDINNWFRSMPGTWIGVQVHDAKCGYAAYKWGLGWETTFWFLWTGQFDLMKAETIPQNFPYVGPSP